MVITLFFLCVLVLVLLWLYVKEKTKKELAEYDAELYKRGHEFWRKSYIEAITKTVNRKP